MGPFWLNDGFITKELYAPYVIERDCEYLSEPRKQYDLVLRQATRAKADPKSLEIIRRYRAEVLNALHFYYKADIEESNQIIRKLVDDVASNDFAISELSKS